MRPYECSLTSAGRQSVLELLLAARYCVRIRRIEDAGCIKEEWRIGPLIRNEWCELREEGMGRWHATFGGNLKFPVILEPVFSKVICEDKGCTWIWPKESLRGQ